MEPVGPGGGRCDQR